MKALQLFSLFSIFVFNLSLSGLSEKQTQFFLEQATVLEKQGEYGEALRIIQRLEKEVKNPGSLYFRQGILYYRMELYDQALHFFDLAHIEGPNNCDVQLFLGLTYLRLEQFDQARKTFLHLATCNDYDELALKGLESAAEGHLLLQLEDISDQIEQIIFDEDISPDLALDKLMELRQQYPDNHLIPYKIGRIYYDEGEFEKARYWLELAHNHVPDSRDYQLMHAYSLINNEEPLQALLLLYDLLEQNVEDKEAIHGLYRAIVSLEKKKL